MRKAGYRIMSIALFMPGFMLSLNMVHSITGAVIGIGVSSTASSLMGVVFLLSSIVLFVLGEKLDEQVEKEHRWRKYHISPDSTIEDLEQEYLSQIIPFPPRSSLQEHIERTISRGRPIEDEKRNKRRNYQEQFYEGHAAQGGRVIEVESHIAKQGKHKGKLIHFGQPANGRYLWIIDEEENFIIANRQTFHHEMS